MGGHEAYCRALLGGSRTVWLLPSQTPWSVVRFSGPMRCGSFPRGPLSSPVESGGVIPGTGYLTPIVWLLVELVVSRLLGRTR
jgi:hypothetical protein